MPSLPNEARPASAIDDWSAVALRFLASVKLAIVLLVLLVVVLAVATFVERSEGPGYAQWYVYHSTWFAGLLGLLAANIVAAAVVRYPWKPRHIGFLIAHTGILVLMLGAMLTQTGKLEGRLKLLEGETGDRFSLADHGRFDVSWQNLEGEPPYPPAAFNFRPGPIDWPEGKTFNLGEKSGVHLRVTKYLCRCRIEQDGWIVDPSPDGQPVLQLALVDADGVAGASDWLLAGRQKNVRDGVLDFLRAKVATMLDDFLDPPPADAMDPKGVLAIHYDGKVERIPVGPNVGKKHRLGDSKFAVEIVEYVPQGEPAGEDAPVSKAPRVELRTYIDGMKAPLPGTAIAGEPFKGSAEAHGRNYPVKFWYHHPAAVVPSGAQWMQTPDGKLYCRVGTDGKYVPRGPVREGDVIDVSGKTRLKIVRHLPSAQPDIFFHSVPYSREEDQSPPAVRLEVTAGGETQEVWLWEGNRKFKTRSIRTPEGPLEISFGDDYVSLGFKLQLLKLNQVFDPGGEGEPVVSSTVRLVDKSQELDEEREIGLNQPLEHGKFRFFQSGTLGPFSTPDGTLFGSSLGVTTDPGHWPKYIGSAMLCVGILFVFFRKAPFGRPNAKTVA